MKRFTSMMFALVLILGLDLAEAKERPQDAAALKAKRDQEAAALLNGTLWSVEMMPLSGEKGKKPLQDTLKFEGGKITSTALSKEGYPTSNYTLTVGEDGLVVWETMQTKEGAGVVFWRGERQGDTMRGILSKQPTEGKNTDYSFSGKILVSPETPPGAPPATATPPEQVNPPPLPSDGSSVGAGAPTQSAPRPKATTAQKKKGWW